MSWPLKPLGEILTPSGLSRAGSRDLPVLSITMKHGLVDQADKFKKRVASSDTSSYRVAHRHELVVGFPIDEGVLGFQEKHAAGIVSPAYDIWSLSQPDTCHIPYLERYLRSDQARHLYASRMQGAVARRRSLPKGDFLKLEIPFPPINDQIRIAHLLGKVEGLIAQRQQHLQQLDNLLKSVFLEMFGDPTRNEKGWDKQPLHDFGKISTGNTPPRNDPENYAGSYIEWIKTDNITSDATFVTSAAEHLSEAGAKRARTAEAGALLVACIAGSLASIGRAALTDRKVAFNQQINAIQPSADVDPIFLHVLFKLSRSYIQSHATKGMKNILSKGDFEQIRMVKPPLDLQREFASVARRVDTLAGRYRQPLADLETLYAALSQSAFKGELDLTRVPLPTVVISGQTAEIHSAANGSVRVTAFAFPDLGLPASALNDEAARLQLLSAWLGAWQTHLGTRPFVLHDFLNDAEARLAELYPEDDLALGMAAYEQIKDWVFSALDRGTLSQGYDKDTKHITLKAAQA